MRVFNPGTVHSAPLPMVEILTSERVQNTWDWWRTNIHPRTSLQEGNCCIYDRKKWDHDNPIELKWNEPRHIDCISCLYVISLLGDISEILNLCKTGQSFPIRIRPPRLEEHYRRLIQGSDEDRGQNEHNRFRYSLSEFLAFWVQLSDINQICLGTGDKTFSLSRPNFLPDDKGPDGLGIIFDENNAAIELRSVKSSIRNPRNLIASSQFRRNGNPEDGKQLDEFYKVAYESYGLGKLEELVDRVSRLMEITMDQDTRIGLLGTNTSYNAMVVANDRYCSYDHFNSFHWINPEATRCIATFIGSNNWNRFSMEVRNSVESIFNLAEVL
jgi:hypothetical protein